MYNKQLREITWSFYLKKSSSFWVLKYVYIVRFYVVDKKEHQAFVFQWLGRKQVQENEIHTYGKHCLLILYQLVLLQTI